MSPENSYPTPRAQMAVETANGDTCNFKDHSSKYNPAFKKSLLIQGVLAILTLLILDFGQTHRAFWVAFLCQWATVSLLLLRRPSNPSRLDLLIVRYGIVPILILIVCAGPWLLRILGLQA